MKVKGPNIGLVVSMYPSSILALSLVRVCDLKLLALVFSHFYSYILSVCFWCVNRVVMHHKVRLISKKSWAILCWTKCVGFGLQSESKLR